VYTSEALLDLETRAHWTLKRLLEHCAGFAVEDLDRELPGFGYPTVRRQVIHVLGAQHYWMGVIRGVVDAEDRDDRYPTVPSIEAWRAEVEAAATAYLGSASTEELNTPRAMTVWGGGQHVLAPARVVVRTLTHIYQHEGQVAAMCRLLGRPLPAGLDFPIK
jgi:uncharacterized damage-inducible protein DinB